MTDREKALEAALRRISLGSQDSGTTKESLGREARAALALPATMDRWEAGRDAAANYVQEMAPSYKEYDSGRDALNDAVDAIRNLTPPEDAP
jgi:uncharacterized coiled-coil DUF342 family protein